MAGKFIKVVTLLCTEERYRKLEQMKKQGNYGTMASLMRDIVDEKRITLDTYDATWDKVLEQLSFIQTALYGIDLTMNQLLIDLQKMDTLKQQQLQLSLILKQHKAASVKMNALFRMINQIAEQCLQT